MSQTTAFVVIYQWRLKTGMEAQFRRSWEQLTQLHQQHRGALGARLHTTDYGSWLAYAQWPSKAAWEASCVLHEQDEVLSQQILDAVEETWSPMFMTLVSDQLSAPPLEAAHHVTH